MRKTFLLGIIKNRIITGDIEITTRNGYKQFTASFDEGEAFNIENIDEDYKNTYYEELWQWSYTPEQKLDLLENGEKTKEEVFENWSYSEDYRDIIDCSCTDYEMEVNGETINFESTCGGQHDVREEEDFNEMIFTNKKAFDLLMKMWDQKHLKEITEEEEKEIEEIEKMLEDYEEESDKFYSFIEKNIEVEV